MDITPTAYLRDDGIEMILDRSTGCWYIRTISDGAVDQTWYWHPKSAQWVRPFKNPSREYLMERVAAETALPTLKHPGP